MQEKEITVKQGIGASSITFYDDLQKVVINYVRYQDGKPILKEADVSIQFAELAESHPEEFATMHTLMTMLADLKRPSLEGEETTPEAN